MKYASTINIAVEHPAGVAVTENARDAVIAKLMEHCREEVIKFVDYACEHVATAMELAVDATPLPIRIDPYCRALCGCCSYWREPWDERPMCHKFDDIKLREVWADKTAWLRCEECLKATGDWNDKTKHNNEVRCDDYY